MEKGKALVVLSGGQDSTICLFYAIRLFGVENVMAITFDYDQRHYREINAARHVVALAGIQYHDVVKLGPVLIGKSPLTNKQEELEKYDNFAQMDRIIGDRVEKTFVPMRNALFLTIAANRAEVLGCRYIVTGVCQSDNANYPDCRAVYILQQAAAINYALGYDKSVGGPGIFLLTPLMYVTKAESVEMSLDLPGAYAALAYTHTAYDGTFPPTSTDHASVLRAQGFLESGWPDPLVLRAVHYGLMETPKTQNYSRAKVQEALVRIGPYLHGWSEQDDR